MSAFLEEESRDQPDMFNVAGGSRILYGYLAIKEDIDIFNRHNKGTKKKLFADFSANMA